MRKSLLATASASLMLMVGINASAGIFRPYSGLPQGAKHGFHNAKLRQAGNFLPKGVDENGVMTPDLVLDATHKGEMAPVGAMLSPKGEHWFYTMETTGEKLNENKYNVTWNYDTFKLTVYDGTLNADGGMNIVGYAYGKANFPEGAKRCQSIVPDLQVTGNFFNNNGSDYEVIMTFNFNPDDTKYYYGAKQMTQVYTLQNAMPAEPQKPVFEVPGAVSGIIDGSTSMTEGWVMSFTYETTWTNEPDEQNKTTLRVYKPAGWGTPPELIATQTSFITPGEGTNDPIPFFIAVHGTDVYSIRTYYEYPWLEDGSDDDTPVMRPDNNFIIEMYKPSAKEPVNIDFTDPDVVKPKPYKTVTIPCGDPSSEEYIWRTYALGNFSGYTDVTWDFSNGGNDPCFIITILDSNVQEANTYFYEVYDINGKKIKEFGERSAGYQTFSDVEGQPKQWGFDVLDEEGSTVTKIMNWPSLEVVGQIPALFEYEGNIFQLSSVPDRVPGEGGVLYAANAALTMGESENAFSYIAYFKADGELHHMDVLRLPENTAKAYAFVEADVLDPYLYNTDSKYEYLIWHYTWKEDGIGTNLALVVVDNEGKILASRPLNDGHSLETAFVSNNPDRRFIVLTWRDASSWENNDRLEFMSLPLNPFEGEGTVENPYLIRTWGDFDRVRNNLTSHFALASNVDLENRAIRPIEGTFLGSIDGRGNSLKNLHLSVENKGALFMQFGNRPDEESEGATTAVLKNIIFDGVTFNHAGSNLGTKQYGLLAHTARFAEFNKVQVVNPEVEIAGVNVEFGTLAYVGDNVTVTDCAVKNADYNIERGNGIGGLVYDVRGSKISGGYFSGTIAGRQNIGAIAGRTNADATTITDCHVDADLTASNQNVGGIVGGNNSRSLVKNNIVEGSITCENSVGGVVGTLAATEGLDQFDMIVEGNVVALDAINAGESPVAVHRIVGYTSIDDGDQYRWVDNPNWDPEDPNSNPGGYEMVPAQPEEKIGVNHVVSELAAIESAEGLATEGTTTPLDDVTEEFFTNLGFKFGSDSQAPWAFANFMSPMPQLYYEDMIGATLQFSAAVYTGNINTSLTVIAIGEGFDIMEAAGSGLLSVSSSNPAVADWAYDMVPVEEYPTTGVGFPFTLGSEAGEAEITVTYKGLTATAKIVVTDPAGIETAVAAKALLAYANGVITAEGCAIEVYDAQGRKVAAGVDELSTADLATGLYIVRAASVENAATMKIMVK